MRYICTRSCRECDSSGTGNCVTPDIKGDPSLHDISCPVGNEPCWRPYNVSVKGYASECPFCGSTKLKLDSKKINSPRYIGPGQWEDGHTGSVRCNSCHARGPTVTVWVPHDTRSGVAEKLKSAVLSKWNSRCSDTQAVHESNSATYFKMLADLEEQLWDTHGTLEGNAFFKKKWVARCRDICYVVRKTNHILHFHNIYNISNAP